MDPAFELEHLEARSLLTGSFDGPPLPVALPTSPQVGAVESIASADFDGDGHIDMAVSFHDRFASGPKRGESGIALYRGRSDGTFDSPVFTTLVGRVGLLLAVRFDGLPVPFGGGAELVSVGALGGTMHPGGVIPITDIVRVLRLDIFTRTFVVEARLRVDLSVIHPGDPFPPLDTIRPSAPVVGEFTGDSRADIAFAIAQGGRGIAIVERPGTGSLVLRQTIDTERIEPYFPFVHTGINDQPLTAIDLDADARQDIVFRTVNGFYALRNPRSGVGAPPVPLNFASNIDWRFSDIDGDHRADALSLWKPKEPPPAGSEAQVFLRVKRGLGPGVGAYANELFFASTERLATIDVGPEDPTGSAFPSSGVSDRFRLVVSADLNADQRSDIFIARDFRAVASDNERFLYQQIRTIAAPPPPNPQRVWPPSDLSLGPVMQQGFPPFDAALGAGVPLLVDLNNDGAADLLQFVNGELEIRLNASGQPA